jgi:hypothetical protein
MKLLWNLLLPAALVAAHGYVDRATIGGQNHQFYQPYQDPYMNPAPQRISRAIPGNGPVEDVNSIDMQCNGWSAGGVVGSKPAPLHATASAGSTVTLYWTLWPDSHVGPSLTYMARCPDEGCHNWQPGNRYVAYGSGTSEITNRGIGRFGSRSSTRAGTERRTTGVLYVN